MNDVTVVIQGPTDFYNQILENLSPSYNYVWSTWEDEPKENLKTISSKIPLALSTKPNYNGPANINLQCLSTYTGIKFANSKYIFKTRGDMVFKGFDKLIQKLIENNKELSFLHYDNNAKQIADFFSFGEKDKMLNFWNYHTDEKHYIPPEIRLTNNYKNLIAPNEPMDVFFKRFYFFKNDLIKDEVDIFFVKINLWFSQLYITDKHLYPL